MALAGYFPPHSRAPGLQEVVGLAVVEEVVEGPGRAAHSPSSQMAAFIHNGCSGPVGSIDLHKKPDFTAQLSLSSLSPPFRPHLPCRGREVSD